MELKELQKYKLEILKDITAICQENGIHYYLYAGTLLGCIRHGGFIPWDDDIDIALKWDDYKKLLRVLEKHCPKRYFVQNYLTDKEYPCLWTQIRVNNTTSMPIRLKNLKMHWGICIDVFPLITAYENERQFNHQSKAIAYAKSLLAKEYMEASHEKARGGQRVLNILPRFVRTCIVGEILRKNALIIEKEKYLCALSDGEFRRKFKKIDYDTDMYHDFEGYPMCVPAGYDSILTDLYGDYMIPVASNNRGGHDLLVGETIIDFDQDYTYYQ